MNQAHIHLLVNHVSLFGVVIGMTALIWSLARNNRDMRWASVLLFVISGVFAWIATESGEGAEEIVEKLPGVLESFIENHEEAAEAANVSIIFLSIGALVMEALARFKQTWHKSAQIVVILLAVVSSVLLARTAQLGGQIRHTEIQTTAEGETGSEGDSNSDD